MAKCCPICGSECYEVVEKNITGILGPGGCIKTLYYVCTGCSVMFQDPARFFREQEGTFAEWQKAHRSDPV